MSSPAQCRHDACRAHQAGKNPLAAGIAKMVADVSHHGGGAAAAAGAWSGGLPVTGDPPVPGTLAERIDLLFRTVHPGRARPYSLREAADLINQAAGEQVISHGYLWELRHGRKTNPSITQIAGLAAFFGVSPLYFFDDAGDPSLDPATRVALSDEKVREVTLRAQGLPGPALRALIDMADSARTLAGLPPVTAPGGDDGGTGGSGPAG
jgi:ESX-1-secreted protein regulator